MALPLQDGAEFRGNVAPASPPPTQLMERLSSTDSGGGEEAGDPDRIPAAVFERDPSESNKDWSMMSTESVFGLQVAPSSDFTGFFLAHPELMDIATPPRSSSAFADADADAKAAPVISPPFESIPELPESAMKGNYSFAFPNLIEDKRNYSKKQSQREHQPEPATPTEVAKPAPAAPAKAEAKAEAQPETSSKPEAAPAPGSGKGGLFSCFPCC
ncbi:hypothetical protein BDA96_10G046400 [Sorghum bicolor]|uniref:Uncharacterized protein n=2 Tax=Sorghum bicolor TaxID=4558 RepID=A0A921PY21_SORBI|nr:uncharacterized protein LOC8071321 [Sorghum bicolor]KAG0512809.1 hypothetical protein BDA96_10G046400 [Sorghum bicolor]KXG19312.1 hypothetical protein SORBI_3010G039700 [Sorghum bicolor]|eukprot:XP_021306155.1 uncharacterized protein LOC8071321 [Sorghum bicolor]